MARLQIADGLAKAGQRTEAAAIIKGILTKLMRFLGAAHPQTVAAAEALASLAQPTDGAAEEEPNDGAAEEEPTNGAAEEEPTDGAAEEEPAALAGVGAPVPVAGGGAASRAEASLALAVAKVEANR